MIIVSQRKGICKKKIKIMRLLRKRNSLRLSINPRTAKMQKSKPAQTKNLLNKTISHSRKKWLCESIFAYCVNHSSTYLCTPVGAVSLSACVSQRLQRVEKYFFDTLSLLRKRNRLLYFL
jgi:hypothetical protein